MNDCGDTAFLITPGSLHLLPFTRNRTGIIKFWESGVCSESRAATKRNLLY